MTMNTPNTSRRWIGIAVIAIVVLVALFVVFWQEKPSDETLRFGYQPFGSNLPFFVAVERGLFEERGLAIEPVSIISANDAASAVVRGEIVGNATVPLNVLLNIEETSPGLMKIFMVKATSADGHWSDYLLVPIDSEIRSLDQLAGKRVGGYPGSAQQSLIRLILRGFVTESEINTVELPPAVQLQALDTGQVDALLTYDERAIQALDEGIGRVLVENPIGKHVVDPLYGFPYVLGTEFISEHPDLAGSVRDAMYEAADFIETNEEEARAIMAKWGGASPEIAQRVNLWSQVKAEEVDLAALQRLADLFYEAEVTTRRVDTSTLLLTENELR